jgi:tryptophanyl-tRNA synthetase
MEEIECEFASKGYGAFKTAVAEAVIEKLEPMQNKYHQLLANPEKIKAIYENGAIKASERANNTINEVYKKIGLIL